MAKEIRVFSEEWHRRIKQGIRKIEQAPAVNSRQRRGIAPGWNYPSATDGRTGGGTGGVGCCCDEMECLRLSWAPKSQPRPLTYEFQPWSMACGCDPVGAAGRKVVLYPTTAGNANIWESKHGPDDDPALCLGSESESVDCTITSRWRWVLDECNGGCTYVAFNFTDPASGTCVFGGCVWGKVYHSADVCGPGQECNVSCVGGGSDVTGGCTGYTCPCVDECPDGCQCDEAAFNALPAPTTLGETVTVPCVQIDGAGHWEFISSDIPEGCICSLVPTAPDYEPEWDGTGDNPEAETSCLGGKLVDGSETLLVSFWRLTVVEALDYYGCDQTKLEFFIGSLVVVSYHLQTQCGNARPFCRTCVNSFKVSTCNSRCTSGPTVICLLPNMPGPIGWTSFCGEAIPQTDGAGPAVLSLQFSPGTETDISGTPAADPPKCSPPLDPIPLYWQSDKSLISLPSVYITPPFIDADYLVYESEWMHWPGPSDEANQCFSGLVKFQYYILRPPYTDDPSDSASLSTTYPCGFKVFRILFHGDGHHSNPYGGIVYPCGATMNGITMLNPGIGASGEIPAYSAEGDHCHMAGTPDDPYYGWLLGRAAGAPWQAYGYIPYVISLPTG